MSGFDVEAARKEGYTDAEIAQHLLDINDADREGASDAEVISTLAPISVAPVSEESAPVPKEQYSVQDPLAAGMIYGGLYQAGNLASRPFHKTAPVAAPKEVPVANPSEMLVIPKDLPTTEFPSPELSIAEAAQKELAGQEKWNKNLTGQNLPGSQMDAGSLARNREHAYNVNKALSEGPLAGGLQTESGLLVDAKERARIEQQAREMQLEAARQAARDKLAKEELSAAAKKEAGRAWLAKQGAENALIDTNAPPAKTGPSTLVKANSKIPMAVRVGAGAYNAQDAWNNYVQNNPVRATIGATGALAPVITSLSRNPKTRAIGAGLSFAAPAINRAIDYFYPPENKAGGGKVGALEAIAEPIVKKLSEALGDIGAEGKNLATTQADRTIVGKGQKGGPGFPSLQHTDPEHAAVDAVWGVGKPEPATMMINANKRDPQGGLIWTNYVGSQNQHVSNPMVLGEMWDAFMKASKEGKLSPEQLKKINARLSKDNLFDTSIDITDPKFLDIADTFEKRRLAGDVMGGKDVGGLKSRIIPYDEILNHYTDPAFIDQPTGVIGNRLFTLDNSVTYNPDIHGGFPYIMGGKDLKTQFHPVPANTGMRNFVADKLKQKAAKGVDPRMGTYDWIRGIPIQPVTEDYLTFLQKEGYADGGKVNYGNRIDLHPKERGFLGEIRSPNGRDVMTEVSVGTPWSDETFRPSIVPGIHPADLNYLRETGNPPLDLINASLPNARRRIAAGKSPFWNAAQDNKYAEGSSVKQVLDEIYKPNGRYLDTSGLKKANILFKGGDLANGSYSRATPGEVNIYPDTINWINKMFEPEIPKAPKQTFVHEQQHLKDAESALDNTTYRARNYDAIKKIADDMDKKYSKKYDFSQDFPTAGFYPELARIESTLPVGQNIWDTELGKAILQADPKIKADYFQAKTPMGGTSIQSADLPGTAVKAVPLPEKGFSLRDFMRNYTAYAGGGKVGVASELGKMAADVLKKVLPETKPAVNRVDMNFKDVTKRVPELTEAANKLAKGEMTASEYDALVNAVKPVTPYNFVPQPATTEDAMRALTKNKQPMYGKTADIGPGEQTDLRLDIPAYRDHGVWINSIHRKDAPTVYGPVSSVKNASMIGAPDKALKVAQGTTPKAPFAVIRGQWNPVEQDAAVANAQEYLNHPDWAQVGYDPERHGYFYNRSTMEPIESAEEVLQIGPLVLAKKPVHAAKSDQLFADGGAVSGLDHLR